MKLLEDIRPMTKSGLQNEQTYRILESAHSFSIISDTLYSDKYSAIVRELSTNASDAHIEAGIDRPIEVEGPTTFSPNLVVKDYGKGIDPSIFYDIYTTVFGSTKTGDNTSAGCFGLGAKSPFAYADQFTIENCHDGIKYIYSCFKNEFGIPSISLLGEFPTQETGLKVSIPVSSDDFSNFNHAIRSVLMWFDITPKSNLFINNVVKNDLFFHHDKYCLDNFVRMGQVIYPTERNYLSDVFESKGWVINAPIGAVDITPSRESLKYTQKTRDFLSGVKQTILESIEEKVKFIRESNSTPFKKFLDLKKYAKDNYLADTSIAPKEFAYISYEEFPAAQIITSVSRECCKITSVSSLGPYSPAGISVKDNFAILICNSRGIKNKVNQFYRDNNYSYNNIILLKEDDVEKVLALGFDKEELVYTSTIKLPSSSKTYQKSNCSHLIVDQFHPARRSTYLPTDQNEGFYLLNASLKWMQSITVNRLQKRFGTIYLFTDTQYKALKIDKRNFTDIKKYLQKEIDDNIDQYAEYLYTQDLVFSDHDKMVGLSKKIPNNRLLSEYVNRFSREHNIDEEYYKLICSFASLDRVVRQAADLSRERTVYVNRIFEKYPLVKAVDGHVEELAEYITLKGE